MYNWTQYIKIHFDTEERRKDPHEFMNHIIKKLEYVIKHAKTRPAVITIELFKIMDDNSIELNLHKIIHT